jgi:hypothetical protein
MILLPHAFLVAGFILGFALQRYLPTHRRNWRFWAIIGGATLGLYIAGHSIFPPELSVGFVLTLSVLVGFAQQWIAPILRRLLPKRLRSALPYLAVGFVIILVLTFVNGNSFMASAVTVGLLLAIFGGLWRLVTRLLK